MTIKEIARMAGVSPAAVSRFFNGGPLGKDKHKRIREIVEETGYRPNPLAQTMRTGKSGQIGVIVPKIHSDSVSRILEGISDVLRRHDCIMILGCTYHDPEQECRFVEAMQENHTDGLILMGRVLTEPLAGKLRECRVPVVVTGQDFEGMNCIRHDDYHAVRELTAKTVGECRKHPAFIGVLEEDRQAGQARREGFEDALREKGFDPEKAPKMIADFTPEDGERAMRLILADCPGTDAVVCASDHAAVGAMRAIREAGYRIPEDIALSGCGDSWAGSLTDPPLTSVHFFYEECGVRATEMLLKMIKNDNRDGEPEKVVMGYRIVDRGSV